MNLSNHFIFVKEVKYDLCEVGICCVNVGSSWYVE